MKDINGFPEKILVGITGTKDRHWQKKIKEIDKFNIEKVALFLERFHEKQIQEIYKALLNSKIKEIPLVHIKDETKKEELDFLSKKFNSTYFTIHESGFDSLKNWGGYYRKLYLEMDVNNFVSQSVEVRKIGGFCIDLSHFKVQLNKWSREFEYILKRRHIAHYFDCNHLNGYSAEDNDDLHTVKNSKDFNYLTSLPKFVFGDVIALEVENSISEQLEFKKYLSEFLSNFLKDEISS
jgi:hypothetical protein